MAEVTNKAQTDAVMAALGQIPPTAALVLRDYIQGLEAEAGNARAELARVRREAEEDVNRMQAYVASVQAMRDNATRVVLRVRGLLGKVRRVLGLVKRAVTR